ncbi:Aste57867_20612 [Aphanomyces stellatus]|uniref:Protein phosphatase n=1 Tax=Aphanomyces stellatus TaxID=120398 RepID=A0A485LFY6_9STRA|nr:hypothetical protein As57867_020544 [Aphanomyces stellatus]VFT97292.1 Aste57867_20612 [Aphanomyces stellatus]
MMLRLIPRAGSTGAHLHPSLAYASSVAARTPGSKRHMHQMTAADLLKVAGIARSQKSSVVSEGDNLSKAMATMANHPNSSTLVVVDDGDRVVGLLTQHKIISHIVTHKDSWATTLVKDAALPSKDIVHVTPEDSLQDCRAVMALTGRGELPVLDGDSLLGIISLTDIAALIVKKDSQADGEAHSAKSDYVHLIVPRKGLPKNTSLDPRLTEDDDKVTPKFVLHSFAMSIPHPQKVSTGGEDAFFIGTEPTVPEKGTDVLCFGVSDGVGSWFEQGFSAGMYSRELMSAAQAAAKLSMANQSHVNPSEVLHAAWQNVSQKSIMGSATACVVALDPIQGELYAVNLGDSGFLIIRDKRSDLKTAEKRGTLDGSLMRKMKSPTDLTPAGRRKGAHVSYRSPQQLHYFNCPFQLGHYIPGPDMPEGSGPLFETPADGVNLRVPVEDGDLIILATDGLFDNVDEEQLLEIVAAEPDVENMTRKLVKKAYDLSLDRKIDSPFARLAKENDKMWGGGMPDDITIIVARVVKRGGDA